MRSTQLLPLVYADLHRIACRQVLHRFETLDFTPSAVVELRAFGGLTIEEASKVFGVSPSTPRREWRTAKARPVHEPGRGNSS
jgi:DNA-directed RNA polymerase specialized sigma24 family protein